MSVSPNDQLSLADSVLKSATTEAEIRNAVGRAYYATYHAAKAFHDSLPSPGQMPPKPTGAHMDLAHRLTHPTILPTDPRYVTSRDVGRELMWLHTKRVKADYEIQATFTEAEAKEVLQ